MPEVVEKEYKTDPFSFVFRELDIVHREITELKAEIREINRRFDDVNKRFDDFNKRLDRLYLVVIVTLIGTLGSLLKLLFFS